MKWVQNGTRWELEGHSFWDSPYIQEAEFGYHVQGKHTKVKGFKGHTKASLTRAKKYAERELKKYNISNPQRIKKNVWIKAKAIKFNKNGSVSIKK